MQSYEGTVKNIHDERGFGFISQNGGPDIFFHCSQVRGMDFDGLLVGRRVEFATQESPKGLTAINVRPAQ